MQDILVPLEDRSNNPDAGQEGQTTSSNPFLSLPSELFHEILSYLSCIDLVSLSATCRHLRDCANDDLLWMSFVNSNLLSPIDDPAPFDSFKSLYISHHPLWFVVRNKIWFSDAIGTGKVILARYDRRRGAIEAYRIVAEQSVRHFEAWSRDPNVVVHLFDPRVRLWLDDPVIQLDKFIPSPQRHSREWRKAELRMPMAMEAHRVFNSFILCRKVLPEKQDHAPKLLWPPETIPSDDRVTICYDEHLSFQGMDDKPQHLDDICKSAFRLKRWVQFGNYMAVSHIGMVISTYATLRPHLYTPTKEKPYQGIWVGDYPAHGPELLLILQRDEPSSPDYLTLKTLASNDDSLNLASCPVQGGTPPRIKARLEAIKLTGDANVPRGEISFLADDIGYGGLIRIADEDIFKGARVVRSHGHIASTNFRNGEVLSSLSFHVSSSYELNITGIKLYLRYR